MRKAAGPGITTLVGVGLALTDWRLAWLGYVCLAAAAVWTLYFVAPWHRLPSVHIEWPKAQRERNAAAALHDDWNEFTRRLLSFLDGRFKRMPELPEPTPRPYQRGGDPQHEAREKVFEERERIEREAVGDYHERFASEARELVKRSVALRLAPESSKKSADANSLSEILEVAILGSEVTRRIHQRVGRL